ncbi:trna rrna methyltransferase -like protein, partial [Nannochloropsis gaditana CCMP526]|uniref:trna rrna methyltransferase -like protein n=1 Tax=Nannochloropsis gaditana (strain CCMP526) TaxID=1093141 RepID=UPI00029F6D78
MEGYDYIYGVSPVLSALLSRRRDVEELYVQEGMTLKDKKDKAAVSKILAWGEEGEGGACAVKRTVTQKHYLNLLADNRPHQGF